MIQLVQSSPFPLKSPMEIKIAFRLIYVCSVGDDENSSGNLFFFALPSHIFKYLSSAVCLLSRNDENFRMAISVFTDTVFLSLSLLLATRRPTRGKKTHTIFLPLFVSSCAFTFISIDKYFLKSHRVKHLKLIPFALPQRFPALVLVFITSWSVPTTLQSHFLSVWL